MRQCQGDLDGAIAAYRRALTIKPHARLHLNLGSALRNQGHLAEAIEQYRAALSLEPGYAEAHDRLGSALWAQGHPEAAVASYRSALAIQPDLPEAHYNLAVFLQDAGHYPEAVPHFQAAQINDAAERSLYCLYKTRQFEAFRAELEGRLAGAHRSPYLATLSAHYATNFGTPDLYGYCPRPLEFVYHQSLPELAAMGSPLLAALLDDITHTEISERKQGRLYNGIQSAGNLFRRSEPSFRELADLILAHVRRYPGHFAAAGGGAADGCELIRSFPAQPEFSSSWYLRMQQGGHLTSHIHEEGWISGCVYIFN